MPAYGQGRGRTPRDGKELEKEAATATNEDDDDDKEIDQRYALKFADRFRLVEKNKAEGTELSRTAIFITPPRGIHARSCLGWEYDRARGCHEDQRRPFHEHGLCWTKLQNNDQALKMPARPSRWSGHPAFYRRAALYEKTSKFDEAKADLKRLKANEADKAALALEEADAARHAKGVPRWRRMPA